MLVNKEPEKYPDDQTIQRQEWLFTFHIVLMIDSYGRWGILWV
jgi:hypothetical protein